MKKVEGIEMEMEERKKGLNEIVLCVSIIVLVIGLLIAIQGLGERISLEIQSRNLPFDRVWSSLGVWQMEQASKRFVIGAVLSLIGGAPVYMISVKKFDVEEAMGRSKKKVGKKVSKKLKQMLEESDN